MEVDPERNNPLLIQFDRVGAGFEGGWNLWLNQMELDEDIGRNPVRGHSADRTAVAAGRTSDEAPAGEGKLQQSPRRDDSEARE